MATAILKTIEQNDNVDYWYSECHIWDLKKMPMIHNALFRQCLAAVPEDQKAEFELSYAIAERISEVLQAKNLTQKDFAQRLHKRESEISKWMTGRHNFTMQTIAKIETALGCKLINIARWYLQTKGKENLSSPCFFVLLNQTLRGSGDRYLIRFGHGIENLSFSFRSRVSTQALR